MKLIIKNWLKQFANEQGQETVTLEQAMALLLYEAANADYALDDSERQVLLNALQQVLGVTAAEAQALFDWAEAHAVEATSLRPFTQAINQQLQPAAKTRLMEQLWRVAYADGRVDKYEEHYLRHIADLIYLPHSVFIKAKLAVRG